MKERLRLVALLALASGLFVAMDAAVNPVAASTLWYNGDSDLTTGTRNNHNLGLLSGCCVGPNFVYDDFVVPESDGRWMIDSVWSNSFTFSTQSLAGINQATWAIRSNVTAGDGGTRIAGGTSPATLSPTGRNFGGFGDEYTVMVTGLNVDLSPGRYWLAVSPAAPEVFDAFNSFTAGLNSVGMPAGNNQNAFRDADTVQFGPIVFEPLSSNFTDDFSMGVGGRTGVLLGDMDCDGDVDFDDIDDFVLGLNDPAGYEDMYGVPPELKGNTDGDGDHDFDDIAGFIAILNSQSLAGIERVPEPPAVFLGVFALALLYGRWRSRPIG